MIFLFHHSIEKLILNALHSLHHKITIIGARHSPPLSVTLAELLANPHQYHLKKVSVIGIVNIEFEGNALFLDRQSWQHKIYLNSLWLTLSDRNNLLPRASGQHLLIEGIFDINAKGHLGLWPGGITNVTRCKRVNSPERDECEGGRLNSTSTACQG